MNTYIGNTTWYGKHKSGLCTSGKFYRDFSKSRNQENHKIILGIPVVFRHQNRYCLQRLFWRQAIGNWRISQINFLKFYPCQISIPQGTRNYLPTPNFSYVKTCSQRCNESKQHSSNFQYYYIRDNILIF